MIISARQLPTCAPFLCKRTYLTFALLFPGQCPATLRLPSKSRLCTDRCSADDDCRRDSHKCCSTNCGKRCMPAVCESTCLPASLSTCLPACLLASTHLLALLYSCLLTYVHSIRMREIVSYLRIQGKRYIFFKLALVHCNIFM